MLHELLLALLGYNRDLIIDQREQQQESLRINLSEECTFMLTPDISFLQPSERELDRFAVKSRNLSRIRPSNESPLSRTSGLLKGKKKKQSVYRRAIANGIVEVLSIYRSAVLLIEQKLLSDSLSILATVTRGLNKFFVLLLPLYELILEIERDGFCGGRPFNLLHKRCHCGVPELQICVQRLLWHGHQVMYNQLASWMIYGILHDRYGEFFISRQESRDAEHDSPLDIIEQLTSLSTNDASLTDWHSGFHISLDMLPEHISMRVAESILFAGKAVRVLRNPSPAIRFEEAMHHQQMSRGLQKPQVCTVQISSMKNSSQENEPIGEELLPQSDADKIETMLQILKVFIC